MAETYSTMVPLATTAPTFTLPDVVSGQTYSRDDLKGERGTVVMFICNHCPFVKHVNRAIVALANRYLKKGIAFIAISSNDVDNYPEDSPEAMRQVAAELQYPFPYLYDESQAVAKAYEAACTPDFYLFDSALACVYRGRLDETRPYQGKAAHGGELKKAITNLLAGSKPLSQQHPSVGCNIKWRNS